VNGHDGAVRVIVAEDSLLLRQGIETVLGAEPDIEIVASCADYDALMTAISADPPDVVLTDIRMPPSGTDEGIRAATALRASHPDVGVVVLSQYAEPAYALQLFEEGSQGRGYLLKERIAQPEQLVGAIREVADGGSVVDSKVVDLLVSGRRRAASSPVSRLTPREREVLAEIATGKNNAAIAAALVLSERAVGKHINALFAKLGLAGEADAHHRVKAALLFLRERGG
jgi:DNA-binding NarL/FixJ family response regulator